MNWSNFTSRKFLLALVANITAIVVMLVPKYQSEIVQAVNTGVSLLLMIAVNMGWVHEEAKIDAAAAKAAIDGETQVRMAMLRFPAARMAAAPQPQLDMNELVRQITRILNTMLQGSAADIQTYANVIAMNYQAVIAQPDNAKRAAMLEELNGQVLLLAEVQRLRATNAGWDIVNQAIEMAMQLAVALIVGYMHAYQSNQSEDPRYENDPRYWNGAPAGRPVGLR